MPVCTMARSDSRLSAASRLDNPTSLRPLNTAWTRGLRRSASISKVRLPAWAWAMAKLTAVSVLPSASIVLVTTTERRGLSTMLKASAVRAERKASAKWLRGLLTAKRSSKAASPASASADGTPPTTELFSSVRTSLSPLIVVSM